VTAESTATLASASEANSAMSEGNPAARSTGTARRFARIILNGFHRMIADWESLTLSAQDRFERAAWRAVLAASASRLTIYRGEVIGACDHLAALAADRRQDRLLWREAKAIYAELVATHGNAEIAQTFFNSCYCYTFGHEKVSGLNAFALGVDPYHAADAAEVVRTLPWSPGDDLHALLRQWLTGTPFTLPWADLAGDVERLVSAIDDNPTVVELLQQPARLELLESPFYRNKAAYLIGRLVAADESNSVPLALPVLNDESGGLFIDALLASSDELSVLFSFTRSYFMVDVPFPSRYVRFLKQLMPAKEVFELYTALGFVKHGKTEFYRTAVAHTAASADRYVVAPGTPGMVMYVFTLPSFSYVYKVIKDDIPLPKRITREEVKAKYAFVKQAERAGRMADSQEFRNLAFPLERFSPEVLEALQRACGSQVAIKGRALLLKHVYVERRMLPLNLYVRDATTDQLWAAMDEYGNAIKQLAAANIFPGDMLLKNFGVTRHRRVVFYDYDEVCPLTDCNFRALPQGGGWGASAGFGVQEEDVFPEEFRRFLGGEERVAEALLAQHPELYEVSFWRDMQRQLQAGVVHDVFPYRRRIRFAR
jgi:isocitrate dehydrogenase kinase/phosphatase